MKYLKDRNIYFAGDDEPVQKLEDLQAEPVVNIVAETPVEVPSKIEEELVVTEITDNQTV